MHDKSMQEAIDIFVLERINDCGSRSNSTLQDAFAKFSSKVEQLKRTFSPEQLNIFIDCENAFSLVDGETMNCYYRTGFSDAVRFLLGWRDKEWN